MMLSPCFSKWTPEEDDQLIEIVRVVGLGNWRRGKYLAKCLLRSLIHLQTKPNENPRKMTLQIQRAGQ